MNKQLKLRVRVVSLLKDSTIYIANVVLAVSSKQNFYLTDKGSSMIVQAVSTTQTFNVYGFGDGNKIGLTLPLVGTIFNSAFTYDTASGILTLRNTLLEQKFNIGTGYEPSKFQVVTDSGSGTPSTVLGQLLIMAMFQQELYLNLVKFHVNQFQKHQVLNQQNTLPPSQNKYCW